ncbi:hypothetical protein MTP99_017495 [Tenebrio molitor]|jgi:hypothetical protein|nr:hypothetical protein MTP99_017495 [Tenebrio molitor]
MTLSSSIKPKPHITASCEPPHVSLLQPVRQSSRFLLSTRCYYSTHYGGVYMKATIESSSSSSSPSFEDRAESNTISFSAQMVLEAQSRASPASPSPTKLAKMQWKRDFMWRRGGGVNVTGDG